MRFADMEDSATLGSDMSAISDLREAVRKRTAFYVFRLRRAVLPPRQTKAINPGAGAEPRVIEFEELLFR